MTRIAREQESYGQTQDAAPTRRLFLGAGSAAAVFGAVGAAAYASPDAELIALGRELKTVTDFETAVLALNPNIDDESACNLAKPCSVLVDRIAGMSATTIQGLIVKAHAVNWCHADQFDGFGETTDERIAAGIIRDLLALAA
jgi:hypothetical protein